MTSSTYSQRVFANSVPKGGASGEPTTPSPGRENRVAGRISRRSTRDRIDHPRHPDRPQELTGRLRDPGSVGCVLADGDEGDCGNEDQGEESDRDAHAITLSDRAPSRRIDGLATALHSTHAGTGLHPPRSIRNGLEPVRTQGHSRSSSLPTGRLVTVLQRPAGQPGLTV